MYKLEEFFPAASAEVECRDALLEAVRPTAEEYDLDMEAVTAQEEAQQERMQVVFLNTSTRSGPWCVGAIVRRNNGEFRVWSRDDDTGPMVGSSAIDASKLEDAITKMVEQHTVPA